MHTPFTVTVPGDPEGTATLVFAASYPYLLVGPKPGESRMRWVRVDECDLSRVLFDSPWHSIFSSPQEHAHE